MPRLRGEGKIGGYDENAEDTKRLENIKFPSEEEAAVAPLLYTRGVTLMDNGAPRGKNAHTCSRLVRFSLSRARARYQDREPRSSCIVMVMRKRSLGHSAANHAPRTPGPKEKHLSLAELSNPVGKYMGTATFLPSLSSSLRARAFSI